MAHFLHRYQDIVHKPDVLSKVLSDAPVAGPADAGPADAGPATTPDGSVGNGNPAFTYFRAWTDLFQPRIGRIDRQITIRQISSLVNTDRNINDCFDLYYKELNSKLTQLIIEKIIQEQAEGFATNLKIEEVRKLLESRDRTHIENTLRAVLYKSDLYLCNGDDICRLLFYDMDLLKKDCYKIISRPDVLSRVLSGEYVTGTNSHTNEMSYPPKDDPIKGKRRR